MELIDGQDASAPRGAIESLTKFSLFLLGVLYVCGFAVVLIHLSYYGVFPVEFLRTQYVAAGALALAPVLLAHFFLAYLYHELKGVKFSPLPDSWLRRIFHVVWVTVKSAWKVAVVFAFCGYVLVDLVVSIFLTSPGPEPKLLWNQRGMFLVLALLSFGIAGCLAAAREFIGALRRKEAEHPLHMLSVIVLLVTGALLFSFFYMAFFAARAYPQIPYAIGGGKPLQVEFLLHGQKNPESVPLLADPSGDKSIPYSMILETADVYVVLSPNPKERAIQINRDAVAGYIILPDK
jgi:hypothetical protein